MENLGCETNKPCWIVGSLKELLKMMGITMCLLPFYMFLTSICFYLLIHIHNFGASKIPSKGFKESIFALVN